MPGVGVTDAAQIFDRVGARRPLVLLSVVAQLVSAVLYVPALLGIVADAQLGARASVRRSAGTLLVGAMGSAADAVIHLLAYAMTAPGLEPTSLLAVMAYMQGPGLRLVLPLIAAFFVGGAWLSAALARAGLVPRANPLLHAAALAIAILGGTLAATGAVAPRAVGLTVLAMISAAQAWIGLALSRSPREP
jgi:hypothetical protein